MAISTRIASAFRRFAANQRGNTAITFALSIVPLLLASGAAVDYMRYADTQTKLQAALDSASLAIAAASNLSHSERIAAGQQSFEANLKAFNVDPGDVEAKFKLAGATVNASARYELPSGLMQIAGLATMTVAVDTEINVPEAKKGEIALVLDYSGSMTEVVGGKIKYVAMKDAAKKLVSDLEETSAGRVKFGLVPFSHHVQVTLPERYVLGKTGTGQWTGCTQDRPYPANITDAAPTASDATKWGQKQAKVHAGDGCGAYVPSHLTVAPLTDDFAAIRGQLEAMRPYAWTHIALGAEFGYHLLSPNAPFEEGADYDDEEVQKIMVILTDGRQTEPAFGSGVRDTDSGESNLEAICQNAKDSGITVMTVAFDLRDKDTRRRLKNCSTDPDKHFFIAENGADIARAFDDIKKQITAQVFISK